MNHSRLFAVAALGAVLMFPGDSVAGPFQRFRAKRQASTVQAPTNIATGGRQCRVVNGQLVCDDPGPAPAASTGSASATGPKGNAPYGPGIAAPTRATAARETANGSASGTVTYIVPAGCRDADGNGICDLHGNLLTPASGVQSTDKQPVQGKPQSVQETLSALEATIAKQEAERKAAERAVYSAAAAQSHALRIAKIEAEAEREKQSLNADLERAEFEAKIAGDLAAKREAVQSTVDQQAELQATLDRLEQIVTGGQQEPTLVDDCEDCE